MRRNFYAMSGGAIVPALNISSHFLINGSEGQTPSDRGKRSPYPLQDLLSFASRRDKVLTFVGAGINVLTGSLLPVCVLFSGKFLDAAQDRDRNLVDFWCGLQFLSGVCCFVAGWVGTWCLERSAESQYAQMKAAFFHSLLDQDQDYLMSFDSGELSDLLSQCGKLYKDALGLKLGQIVVCLSQFTAGFIVGMTQHWRLTILLLGMVPVLVLGGGITLWSLSLQSKRTSYQEAANVLEETITNMKTIISFNLENTFLEKYARLLSNREDTDAESTSITRRWSAKVKRALGLTLVGLGMGISMGSLFAFYALGFWAQGKMLVKDYRRGCLPDQAGCLSVGKGITVFFCIAFGSFSLGQTPTPIGAVIKGRHSIRLLKDIIYRKSRIPVLTREQQKTFKLTHSRTLPIRSRELGGLIELCNVGYAYTRNDENSNLNAKLENASANIALEQTRRLKRLQSVSMDTRLTARNKGMLWVFRNVSISIKPGQIVAFIGPSGCGKSTVAKLLLRFTDVIEGSVALDGVDIRAHDINKLRDQIGYVGQEPQLFDDTIYNNILHGNRFAGEADVFAAARAANAHTFIMNLQDKYATVVGEAGSRLSGGQRQRVAIARALLRAPRILVLDEATSALDNKSEAIILHNIHSLVKERGTTVIMIAHRLTTLRLCDAIFVFNTFANVGLASSPCKSFLQEQGSHNYLVDLNGLYCQMLRSQNITPQKVTTAAEPAPPPTTPAPPQKRATITYSIVDEDGADSESGEPVLPKVPALNFRGLAQTARDSPRLQSFQPPIPSPRGRPPLRVSQVPRPLISTEEDFPPMTLNSRPRRPQPSPPPVPDIRGNVVFATPLSHSADSPSIATFESDGASDDDGFPGLLPSPHQPFFEDEGRHRAVLEASYSSNNDSFGGEPLLPDGRVQLSHPRLSPTELIEGGSWTCCTHSGRLSDHDGEPRSDVEILMDHTLREARFGACATSSDGSMFILEQENSEMEHLNLYPDFVSGSKASMSHFWRFFGYGGLPAIFCGLLGAVGNGAIFPLFAYCFSRFIAVLSKPSIDAIENGLWDPTRLLLLVSALCFVCNVLQHTCVEISGNRLVKRLRFVLFDHVVHLPASFFALERLAPGYLMSLISNDPLMVKAWASDFVFIICQNIASLTLATVIASRAHFRLAMISLAGFCACLPATILQQMIMTRRTMPSRRGGAGEGRGSDAMVVECLRNPKTVSAFNLHIGLALEFDKALTRERSQGYRQAVLSGFFFGLGQLCQFGAQSLNLWCGGRAYCDGQITDEGQMMQATFTMIITAMGIGQAASAALDATKGKASARRIQSMLDVPIPVDKRDEQLLVHQHTQQEALIRSKSISQGPLKQCHIRVQNLRFAYPPAYVLPSPTRQQTHHYCCRHHVAVNLYETETASIPNGQPVYYSVDLDIPSGKSVALVGESGCGKTTLIQLLERFYEHAGSNRILINGVCIKRWPLTQLHELMALVPQEPILFNDSVARNIAYGNLQGDFDAVVEAAKQASAHEFIMQLPQQYDTCVGLRGERLSGGQRQKIAIARALMKNAPILLLDEATSALDPVSEVAVQKTLDVIASRSDRTIITIAHRLSSIRNYDIIAVFEKLSAAEVHLDQPGAIGDEHVGSIIKERGNHETLLAHEGGLYRRLVMAATDAKTTA